MHDAPFTIICIVQKLWITCTLHFKKSYILESTYETQLNLSFHWIELCIIVLPKTLKLKVAWRMNCVLLSCPKLWS